RLERQDDGWLGAAAVGGRLLLIALDLAEQEILFELARPPAARRGEARLAHQAQRLVGLARLAQPFDQLREGERVRRRLVVRLPKQDESVIGQAEANREQPRLAAPAALTGVQLQRPAVVAQGPFAVAARVVGEGVAEAVVQACG